MNFSSTGREELHPVKNRAMLISHNSIRLDFNTTPYGRLIDALSSFFPRQPTLLMLERENSKVCVRVCGGLRLSNLILLGGVPSLNMTTISAAMEAAVAQELPIRSARFAGKRERSEPRSRWAPGSTPSPDCIAGHLVRTAGGKWKDWISDQGP